MSNRRTHSYATAVPVLIAPPGWVIIYLPLMHHTPVVIPEHVEAEGTLTDQVGTAPVEPADDHSIPTWVPVTIGIVALVTIVIACCCWATKEP